MRFLFWKIKNRRPCNEKNKDGFASSDYGSGNRAGADGSKVKEKRFRYSCHYNVRHPGQCDGQSGYGVTKLDAIVESIVCTKFSEILECSKSKLLQDMLRKDMEVAQKEVSRVKSELDLKDDERNGLHINWGNTDRETLINAAIAAVDDDMAFCDVLRQCVETKN